MHCDIERSNQKYETAVLSSRTKAIDIDLVPFQFHPCLFFCAFSGRSKHFVCCRCKHEKPLRVARYLFMSGESIQHVSARERPFGSSHDIIGRLWVPGLMLFVAYPIHSLSHFLTFIFVYCSHSFTHTLIFTHTHADTDTHTHTRARAQIHTHCHADTHTHTHTQTHT